MAENTINDIVLSAQNTNWQKGDDFNITIVPKTPELDIENVLNVEGVKHATVWKKSIVSVSLPQMSAATVDKYLGGERRITNQTPELFRFTMRFRDFEAGALRRYFITLMVFSRYNYAAESYLTININDYNGETLLFSSDKVLIENVGDVSLSYAENNISEFTVSFVSAEYSDEFIKKYGNKKYIEKFIESKKFKTVKTAISELPNSGSSKRPL